MDQPSKRKHNEISQSSSVQWCKMWSEKYNRIYWQNQTTGESTWEDKSDKEAVQPLVNSLWKKHRSRKHDRDYWINEETGESTWEQPFGYVDTPIAETKPTYEELIELERLAVAYNDPTCPREIDSYNIPMLVARLRSENAVVITDPSKVGEHRAVFTLPDEDTSHITRAFQEDQILKVRLKLKVRGEVIDLRSFWEVWDQEANLRLKIKSSTQPHEEKWKCMREFQYKIATTFMPGYAKAIYDYFQAEVVLDPCSGWGDRMLGAEASTYVKKYIGFDPNMTLRPGYANTMKACGHAITAMSPNCLKFSNSFEIHSYPFEEGVLRIPTESVDLVFTSPPFFDYEMYNPNNPQYVDWISGFYDPFVIHACRCVKPGNYVGIYIGDTSAGKIEEFIRERVHTICPMDLVFSLGFVGIMSDKVRGVWIFKKKNFKCGAFHGSHMDANLCMQFPLYARAIEAARGKQEEGGRTF